MAFNLERGWSPAQRGSHRSVVVLQCILGEGVAQVS